MIPAEHRPIDKEHPVRRAALTVIALGLAAAGLAGCGAADSDSGSRPAAEASASPSLSGSVTVFAAASLTESFNKIGEQFQAAHPGVRVTFSFAASSALATQIAGGAPADVFASASAKNMDQVVAGGDAKNPTTFAKNEMEIAVPPANPGNVAAVADLAKPAVKVARCQPQVPCGAVAQQVFGNAKITVKPVTLEPDVKSVLSKVTLGEVDAGMVYVTDVLAAGDKAKGVEIPAEVNASTSYPIAALTGAPNPSAAQAFVDYVLSADGQSVLKAAGFAQP
jgi:molybdate transport system substrate-binding protein